MTAGNNALPAGKIRMKCWLLILAIFATLGLTSQPAVAHTKIHHIIRHVVTRHVIVRRTSRETIPRVAITSRHATHKRFASVEHHSRLRLAHYYFHRHHVRFALYHHSWLQCVPYAREVSHIDLSGDAFLWWAEAAGRYARGNTPVEGAVLNFRPIRRMPLGHVAVVTGVIDSRTILVTQANWVPGTITNDVTVDDVSDNNDWSEVQVELGDGAKMGDPYPTYGFIYNEPDNGTIIAGTNPAQSNEVAEAPTAIPTATDAPNRNLQ
jgi:hypothetical protein